MASNLPHYVASAQPVPLANRVPWYKSTAQTYAGIMLWFVFWESVPSSGAPNAGGILAQGLLAAVLGVIAGALICHFGSYLAPGMMGMKTGLPLAVVGTSTYGVNGGFLMPGFFMGILQFGWLAVNSYFSAKLLAWLAGSAEGSVLHLSIGVIWALVAAFVGLKGHSLRGPSCHVSAADSLGDLVDPRGQNLCGNRKLRAGNDGCQRGCAEFVRVVLVRGC